MNSLDKAMYWPSLRGIVTFCMVSRMRPCCGSLTSPLWTSLACRATAKSETKRPQRGIEKPGAFWSDYFTKFTSHALPTVMKYVAPSSLVHASWIIFAGM
jgi:hypothetical protein